MNNIGVGEAEGLVWLLAPPNSRETIPYVGREKLKWFKNGIMRLDGQFGSYRYVQFDRNGDDSTPIAGLMVSAAAPGSVYATSIYVVPTMRRRGLALMILKMAERDFEVLPTNHLSKDGAKLQKHWMKLKGKR